MKDGQSTVRLVVMEGVMTGVGYCANVREWKCDCV